jgi:hypothetical protein
MFPDERKNQLLKEWKDRKITLLDLITKCAEWTAEDIDKYEFTPIPIKPRQVIDYENIPQGERRMLQQDYYKDNPEINAYYEEVNTIRGRNNAIYEWLKQCLDLVKTQDEVWAISKKLQECEPEQLLVKNIKEAVHGVAEERV